MICFRDVYVGRSIASNHIVVPDMFFTSVKAPSKTFRDNQVLIAVHKLLLKEGTPNRALNQYKPPNLHGCTKFR